MKQIKKIILLLVVVSSTAFTLDIYEDIANSIRSGDARQLSTFFGNSIELSIGNQENVYSNAQAELVIRDFFSKNSPKSFSILHKGSSPEGTQYAIGTLQTVSGKTFRTSFYVKNTGGKHVIQELRFENE